METMREFSNEGMFTTQAKDANLCCPNVRFIVFYRVPFSILEFEIVVARLQITLILTGVIASSRLAERPISE